MVVLGQRRGKHFLPVYYAKMVTSTFQSPWITFPCGQNLKHYPHTTLELWSVSLRVYALALVVLKLLSVLGGHIIAILKLNRFYGTTELLIDLQRPTIHKLVTKLRSLTRSSRGFWCNQFSTIGRIGPRIWMMFFGLIRQYTRHQLGQHLICMHMGSLIACQSSLSIRLIR